MRGGSVEFGWMERPKGGTASTCTDGRWAAPEIYDVPGFRVALWVASFGIAALLWNAVCTVPGIPWNPARLAPSFALAYGLPIYALRDSGAQLGWFYGPVFPLWYFPATFTDNPTLALVSAAIENIVTLIVPVLLVIYRAGATHRRTFIVAAVFCAALLLGSPSFRWTFYFLHVDTVCLACGLVACTALHYAAQRPVGWALHVAAIAVALALWTKQVAVMLAPGMLIWLWAEGCRRLIWPFFFWCGAYVGLTTAVVFARFGGEEIMFNLVLVHLGNPLKGGGAPLRDLVATLASGVGIWVPAALCCLMWGRRRAVQPLTNDSSSLIRLLLWVALSQLPLGVLASLKAGGGLNSVHSLHYAFVAGVVLVVHVLSQPVAAVGRARWESLWWGAALLLPVASGWWLEGKADTAWTIHRGQEPMLAMVRENPGRYYLPWHPHPDWRAPRLSVRRCPLLFMAQRSGSAGRESSRGGSGETHHRLPRAGAKQICPALFPRAAAG